MIVASLFIRFRTSAGAMAASGAKSPGAPLVNNDFTATGAPFSVPRYTTP